MASYRDYLPAVSSGEGWQRPADWLPMPTVTEAEEKFVGLHGVWEDGDNVVAFLFRGAYTVDWGDGVVENIADNVKAEHQYDWASIPSNTTTSQGYRQVMITVTPNGGNLASCNFQQRFTGRNQPYSTGFLDVTLSMPNCANNGFGFGGATITHGLCERITVLTLGTNNSLTSSFRNCTGLQTLPLFDTSNVVSFQSAFNGCGSLKELPFFNTTNVINFLDAFVGCTSLETVPLFNTANAQNMSGMFQSCSNLKHLPVFNTSSATTVALMVNGCTNLVDFPLINTALVTNMTSLFRNCNTLQSIPALSTASITPTSGTDFSNFINPASSVARIEMVFARSVTLINANLGAPALVEIFNNLVDRSATTSATITITGNWGVPNLTASDLLIATNKNWVVVT